MYPKIGVTFTQSKMSEQIPFIKITWFAETLFSDGYFISKASIVSFKFCIFYFIFSEAKVSCVTIPAEKCIIKGRRQEFITGEQEKSEVNVLRNEN